MSSSQSSHNLFHTFSFDWTSGAAWNQWQCCLINTQSSVSCFSLLLLHFNRHFNNCIYCCSWDGKFFHDPANFGVPLPWRHLSFQFLKWLSSLFSFSGSFVLLQAPHWAPKCHGCHGTDVWVHAGLWKDSEILENEFSFSSHRGLQTQWTEALALSWEHFYILPYLHFSQ